MTIYVHNNMMEIVDIIDNDIPGSLHYMDDTFELYASPGSATFEMTIPKFIDGELNRRLEYLKDDAYLSFIDDDEPYLFSIRKLVETDDFLTVHAETLPMELLNEFVGPLVTETPIALMDALSGYMDLAKIDIGRNDLADVKKVLEFTDENETMLHRIASLIDFYGGELRFETHIYPNGELDKIIIHIYRKRTPETPYDGIGSDRKDIRLYYGREVEGIRRTTDKTNLFNGLRLKDADGNYYRFKRPRERLNEDGRRELFVQRNGHTIYAPISMRKYPSVMKKNNCDNWIVREKVIEVIDDEESMWLEYSNLLAKHMYPEITYEVDMIDEKIFGRHKIKIGDTIYINDENFLEYLIIQARVTRITKSKTNPSVNKVELSNFVTLKSQISSSLMDEMKQMMRDAKPYSLSVKTDNGFSFKEYKGVSTITPELLQGNEPVRGNVEYLYFVNGVYTSMGDTFKVSPQIMTEEKCVVYIEGIHNNKRVANVELTFFNVNDGKSPILMHIETSSGNIFKNGVISTVLTARLWRGEEEIDTEGGAFEYIWTKINDDGTPDTDWNNQHLVSQKSLHITRSDVHRRCTFQCDVTPI